MSLSIVAPFILTQATRHTADLSRRLTETQHALDDTRAQLEASRQTLSETQAQLQAHVEARTTTLAELELEKQKVRVVRHVRFFLSAFFFLISFGPSLFLSRFRFCVASCRPFVLSSLSFHRVSLCFAQCFFFLQQAAFYLNVYIQSKGSLIAAVSASAALVEPRVLATSTVVTAPTIPQAGADANTDAGANAVTDAGSAVSHVPVEAIKVRLHRFLSSLFPLFF